MTTGLFQASFMSFATALRWRDGLREYGPHKTLYNRYVRWSRIGVFDRIFSSLAGQSGAPDMLMIDATHRKAQRTAASLLKKGMFPAVSAAQKDWRRFATRYDRSAHTFFSAICIAAAVVF